MGLHYTSFFSKYWLKAVEANLLIDALPQNRQDKDGCDGWGEVGRDLLDVLEELALLRGLDDRDPQDADAHQHQDKHSEMPRQFEFVTESPLTAL